MKRRSRVRRRPNRKPVQSRDLIPICCMAGAYLAGCLIGARYGLISELPDAVVTVLTEFEPEASSGLLSVFGDFGFYGLFFLILSTTYLGFFLVPFAFLLKGILSGAMFQTYLQSGETHAFVKASICICLPNLFVLPALILLGRLCMQLSFQMLCRLRGAPPSGTDALQQRALAAIAVLFLLAAFTESYVVPTLLGMVST